jgi:hypothetical protein
MAAEWGSWRNHAEPAFIPAESRWRREAAPPAAPPPSPPPPKPAQIVVSGDWWRDAPLIEALRK